MVFADALKSPIADVFRVEPGTEPVMWYDLIIVAILLFAAYRGLQRGVVYQIATIASVVLCFVFAEAISAAAGPYVPLEPPLNNWVIMVGAYIVFSFVAFGFARVLDGWMEKVKLKEFNRHLGAGFGLLKGLAFCLIITFFAVTMSDKARAALVDSKSAYYAAVIMDRIHPVMPEKMQGALDRYLAYFDKDKIQQQTPLDAFGTGLANGENSNAVGLDDLGPVGDIDLGAPTQPRSNTNNGFGGWDIFPNGSQNNANEPFTRNTTDTRPVMPEPDRTNPFLDNPFNTQPSQPTQPTNTNSSTVANDPYSVDAIIERFPWTLSGELERVIRGGLSVATPEQRRQMEQQLYNTAPGQIGDLARNWLNGNLPNTNASGMRTDSNGQPLQNGQPNGGFVEDIAGSIYDRATGNQTNPQQPDPKRDMVRGLAGQLWNQFGNQQQPQTNPQGQTADVNTLYRDIANFYARSVGGQANGYETSIRQQLSGQSQATVAAVLQDWRADITGQGTDPDPQTNRDTLLNVRIERVIRRLSAQPGGSAF